MMFLMVQVSLPSLPFIFLSSVPVFPSNVVCHCSSHLCLSVSSLLPSDLSHTLRGSQPLLLRDL